VDAPEGAMSLVDGSAFGGGDRVVPQSGASGGLF
jgi:hypothetical protein